MAIVTAHVAAVQQLYVAYFNRPADYAGLDYWTTVVAGQKGSTALVSAAFAAEAEYKTEYAGLSNADIVNKIYMNLFGRPAEEAGKAFWAAALDSKATTIDKVVADVVKGAQGSDAEAYENKVSAATIFTAQLDTKAEQDGYRGAAANALAKTFITSVTNDASLEAAVAPVNLATTVSKVVVAGTPFTIAGALASLEVATDAKAAFLVTADGDGKATTKTSDAALDQAVIDADNAIEALLPAAVRATYDAGSDGVKAALVADQVTANAQALVDAQAAVTTANANMAKVAGLQSAISTAAAAATAATTATKAQGVAAADLAAKLAFYNASNTKQVTVAADGTVTIPAVVADPTATPPVAAADAKKLIVIGTDGKLALASGVTETTNPGITALLASSTAFETAEAAAIKASAAAVATQNTVDYIDTSTAEKAELEIIRTKMVDVVVAAGTIPTEAQIAEQLAIFKAKDASAADPEQYETFKGLVDAFYDQTPAENTLTKALSDAELVAKNAATAIETFTKAQAALVKAEALVAQADALDATVAVATKVFTDRGYIINNVDAANEFGSSKSDIFIADTAATAADSTIDLFNLQGSDSLFIGSEYTLVKGALSTGSDAVLEAFVTSVNGNTVISLETSKFGSNAAVAEVVVITLVGVDASTIQLNNGIITSGAPAA